MDSLKQIRNPENSKPVKIESSSFKRNDVGSIADEYSGLSYLANMGTGNKSNNNNISATNGNIVNSNNNNNNLSHQPIGELFKPLKKNSEMDFRVKYKTEKCKFWEINQTCKFGEGVSKFFYFD